MAGMSTELASSGSIGNEEAKDASIETTISVKRSTVQVNAVMEDVKELVDDGT